MPTIVNAQRSNAAGPLVNKAKPIEIPAKMTCLNRAESLKNSE